MYVYNSLLSSAYIYVTPFIFNVQKIEVPEIILLATSDAIELLQNIFKHPIKSHRQHYTSRFLVIFRLSRAFYSNFQINYITAILH